jgi:hypothetical protein
MNAVGVVIGIAVGGLAALLGAAFVIQTYLYVRKASRTRGKIVGNESRMVRSKSGAVRAFFPKFEFEDGRGQKHCVTSDSWSSHQLYSQGNEVEVMYDPANPADARIRTFEQLWLLPSMLIVLGAISAIAFLVLGLWTGVL